MTEPASLCEWLRGALIGVVHLPPLPGSPRAALPVARIEAFACEQAAMLADAGFDAAVIENYGDAPFAPGPAGPVAIACLARIAARVREKTSLRIGINVLRNDAAGALAVAVGAEADFIRVNVHTGAYATDQGIICGMAHETLRLRRCLGANVAIFADVHVKHATPLYACGLEQQARETAYRGLADALVVTGPATGRPAELGEVRTVREAVPDRPVLVGSGVTAGNVAAVLAVADGVIVGTALKREGVTEAPFDPHRLREFVAAARA